MLPGGFGGTDYTYAREEKVQEITKGIGEKNRYGTRIRISVELPSETSEIQSEI